MYSVYKYDRVNLMVNDHLIKFFRIILMMKNASLPQFAGLPPICKQIVLFWLIVSDARTDELKDRVEYSYSKCKLKYKYYIHHVSNHITLTTSESIHCSFFPENFLSVNFLSVRGFPWRWTRRFHGLF